MQHTPLHDWHASHGGRMVDFAGWSMPVQYEGIVAEHEAVRNRVGLFDIAHMGRLWFSGPDALELLDKLLTTNVQKLADGRIKYALICSEEGGILDDVLVYRFGDAYMLVVNASNREKLIPWIEAIQRAFDCCMEDLTAARFMCAVQGPQALKVASDVLGGADLASMRYYSGAELASDFGAVIVTRTGYTGEDGVEIICDAERAVELWEALLAAGEEDGIAPCGLGCRDTLRLEAAMPLYGHEMDEHVDPYTAGLGFGVQLGGDDFVGKAALTELKERTDLPVRVGLLFDGKRAAREDAEIYAGETLIGKVTSGTFSPTLQQPIAMGYVPRSHADVGTELDVDIRGKRFPATVTKLPFYSRPKE